jgi:hypothetical protein
MYVALLCCEVLTIWFFYPETYGRTLEELAFCKFLPQYLLYDIKEERKEGVW